jgi:hypothetical protein
MRSSIAAGTGPIRSRLRVHKAAISVTRPSKVVAAISVKRPSNVVAAISVTRLSKIVAAEITDDVPDLILLQRETTW